MTRFLGLVVVFFFTGTLLEAAIGPAAPCCIPEQFVGAYSRQTGSVGPTESSLEETSGQLVYDSLNQRITIYENSSVNDGPIQRTQIIMNFTSMTRYTIDLVANSSCKVEPIKTNFTERCIPVNATYGGRVRFGYGLFADQFSWSTDDGRRFKSLSDPIRCIPITETITFNDGSTKYMRLTSTFNTSSYIRAPVAQSAFSPPTTCFPSATTSTV